MEQFVPNDLEKIAADALDIFEFHFDQTREIEELEEDGDEHECSKTRKLVLDLLPEPKKKVAKACSEHRHSKKRCAVFCPKRKSVPTRWTLDFIASCFSPISTTNLSKNRLEILLYFVSLLRFSQDFDQFPLPSNNKKLNLLLKNIDVHVEKMKFNDPNFIAQIQDCFWRFHSDS